MLPAATFRARAIQLACAPRWAQRSSSYVREGRARDGSGDEKSRPTKGKGEEERNGKSRSEEESNGKGRSEGASIGKSEGERTGKSHPSDPPSPEVSLMEQLFPERYAAGGAGGSKTNRLVPPIATPRIDTPPPPAPRERKRQQEGGDLRGNQARLHRQFAAQPAETAVLVLHNAGRTLSEEDFRRVIPQGEHLEGWTLERGDILRVIPQRDMGTLAPLGTYYILFSSPLNAFTYRSHVHRVHKLVAENAPSSILSPIPPPPGQTIDGMDAHDAMNSFSLIPPDQNLTLRQLKRPFAPAVDLMVKYGGYGPLVQRKDRMPFEARLALEGPQLSLPNLRYILRASGVDRGLSWSGNDELVPTLNKWEPPADHGRWDSMPNQTAKAVAWAEADQLEKEAYKSEFRPADDGDKSGPEDLKRRTPNPVYIAGFETEHARQNFIHFWHGKEMTWEDAAKAGYEGDVAPIAHVDELW